jgi:hypothetical protein
LKNIHQDRDEGQSGDSREILIEDIRGAVRVLITNSNGSISWSKAKRLSEKLTQTIAPATIIKFATGETKQPSIWTIRTLSAEVNFVPILLPRKSKMPKGAIKL